LPKHWWICKELGEDDDVPPHCAFTNTPPIATTSHQESSTDLITPSTEIGTNPTRYEPVNKKFFHKNNANK